MCKIEIDEAFIVIILFCSSSRSSKYRNVPANFCEMMLLLSPHMSVSDKVVLPWST